jgi:hypothetical protein
MLHCALAGIGCIVGAALACLSIGLLWLFGEPLKEATLGSAVHTVLPSTVLARPLFWWRCTEADMLFWESTVPVPGADDLEYYSLIDTGFGWLGRRVLLYRIRKAWKNTRYCALFLHRAIFIAWKIHSYQTATHTPRPLVPHPADARGSRGEGEDDGQLT